VKGSAVRRFYDAILILVLIAVLVLGSMTSRLFLTTLNINLTLSSSAALGILVIGQTVVLLAGRIDLSAGAVAVLAPWVGTWLIVPKASGGSGVGLGPWLGITVTLGVGLVVALLNALLLIHVRTTANVRLNAVVVTGVMLILLRLGTGALAVDTIDALPETYTYLGSARWLGAPTAVWITGLAFIAAIAVLRYTSAGRELCAVGGATARANGVREGRVVFGAYVVSGLTAAFAGLVLTGRLGVATTRQGQDLIFPVLAACLLGGVGFMGGRRRLVGSLVALITLDLVRNLMVLSGVASDFLTVAYVAVSVVGVLLLLACDQRRHIRSQESLPATQ
jgi:ribose/xylose/arabinose/galactoside ABC-type transport system permease subunit